MCAPHALTPTTHTLVRTTVTENEACTGLMSSVLRYGTNSHSHRDTPPRERELGPPTDLSDQRPARGRGARILRHNEQTAVEIGW